MAPSYALVVFVVLVLVVLVLELTAVLVIQRLVASVRAAGTRRRMRHLAPHVHAAVMGDGDVGSLGGRLTRGDRAIVREMLLHLALDLGPVERGTIAMVYERLGLLDQELRDLRHGSVSGRVTAATNLGLLGGSEVLPALVQALDDVRAEVRLAAVRSVGEIGGPVGLRALVLRLGDVDPNVGECAFGFLAETGHPDLAADLIRFVRTTGSAEGRRRVLSLIGSMKADAYEHISDVLGSGDEETRIAAVRAAATLGDPRFYAVLVSLLDDPRLDVGCQAARGLGRLGSAEAVPPLVRVLRETRSWWLRLHAAAALDELGAAGREALNGALEDADARVRDCARYVVEGGNAVAAVR
jgi:HEAT repeat protein